MSGPSAEELRATGLAIVGEARYLVLATSSPEGEPWISPVWFAHRDLDTFWWISRPGTRHSRLVAANPAVAIAVFDSTVVPGRARAFYAEARAGECPPDELAASVAAYSQRSVAQGLSEFAESQLTGDAEFRLYRAQVTSASLLLDDGGPDVRVDLPAPAADA